jgi:hypothetical protein
MLDMAMARARLGHAAKLVELQRRYDAALAITKACPRDRPQSIAFG